MLAFTQESEQYQDVNSMVNQYLADGNRGHKMDYQQPPAIHQVAPYSGLTRERDGSIGYMLMGQYVSESEFYGSRLWRMSDRNLPPNWKLKVLDGAYAR